MFGTAARRAAPQFTGASGGLWRSHGRAPQALVGVGFVTEGFDANSYFVRLPGSFGTARSVYFAGVTADERSVISAASAARPGYELDASDIELGTPPHALVLAKSVEHSNVLLVDARRNAGGLSGNDAIENPKARGELVFYERLQWRRRVFHRIHHLGQRVGP